MRQVRGGQEATLASFIHCLSDTLSNLPFSPSGEASLLTLGSWIEMRKFAESLSPPLRFYHMVPGNC